VKTYSRSDWNAAQEAWRDFSDEWRDFRHQAAMRGILFPPSGTKYDSWEDDSPSQRAILIRAIREQPTLLRHAIGHSSSWHQVIDLVTRARDDWRDRQLDLEYDERREKAAMTADYGESVTVLSAILARIGDAR
jgi:hypothetical protein